MLPHSPGDPKPFSGYFAKDDEFRAAPPAGPPRPRPRGSPRCHGRAFRMQSTDGRAQDQADRNAGRDDVRCVVADPTALGEVHRHRRRQPAHRTRHQRPGHRGRAIDERGDQEARDHAGEGSPSAEETRVRLMGREPDAEDREQADRGADGGDECVCSYDRRASSTIGVHTQSTPCPAFLRRRGYNGFQPPAVAQGLSPASGAGLI